jgi:hypothetical protein
VLSWLTLQGVKKAMALGFAQVMTGVASLIVQVVKLSSRRCV